MTWEEYNQLFHRAHVNEVAFERVMDCDEELREMVEMAVKEEREGCAKVCDDWPNGRDDVYLIGVAIRARGEK